MTADPLTTELSGITGVAVRVRERLARYTSFKVGGPADYFVEANTGRGLSACLRVLACRGVPVLLLGNGSNLLVSDRGVRGVVVRLRGEFRRVRWRDAGADVGAAYAVSRLVRETVRRGLGGLEFAEGIPGSVGGSLVMNAGAYGSEMERIVTRVETVDARGEPEDFVKEIEARGPDSELKSLGQLIWERGQRTGRSEGRSEGRAEGRSEGVQLGERRATVATVEGLLRVGVDWQVIESATGLDRGGFDALKEQLGSDPAP